MLIDSSALVAIMTDEEDSFFFATKMSVDPVRITIPTVVWEVVVNVARKRDLNVIDAIVELQRFLDALDIEVVAIPAEVGFLSVDAFDRFGKGQHPAALNFGDCIIYAASKLLNQPLLFKGTDFTQTDVQSA